MESRGKAIFKLVDLLTAHINSLLHPVAGVEPSVCINGGKTVYYRAEKLCRLLQHVPQQRGVIGQRLRGHLLSPARRAGPDRAAAGALVPGPQGSPLAEANRPIASVHSADFLNNGWLM